MLKPSLYKDNHSTEEDLKVKLDLRFALYDEIKKYKSVKIHKFQIDSTLLDWIKKNDLFIINLERKDKEKQLKSLLIANHLKKFFGRLQKSKIIIQHKEFIQCQEALTKNIDIHKSLGKPYLNLLYEDLLNCPKTDWFDPERSRHVRQNSSETIEIVNWAEVQEWNKNIIKL